MVAIKEHIMSGFFLLFILLDMLPIIGLEISQPIKIILMEIFACAGVRLYTALRYGIPHISRKIQAGR